MIHHEKKYKKESDPNRILDLHRRGLHKTREAIAPLYRDKNLGRKGLNNSHSSINRSRKAFADSAEQFLKDTDPVDTDTRMYAMLLGVIPSMVESHEVLHRHGTSQNERYSAKMGMIEFNNALRRIIDTDPTIRAGTIVGLVKSTMVSYGYNAEDLNMGGQQTEMVLRGMKHELAFESTLYHLPKGYEVLDTTDEDDKHGADFKVRCPNGVIVSIDIKATPESAENANADQEFYYERTGRKGQAPKDELIIYSGFTDDDFDPRNPWRATSEATQRAYPAIEAALWRASTERLEQLEMRNNRTRDLYSTAA